MCCFSLLLHKELLEFYLSGKLFLLSVQFLITVFCSTNCPEALDVFNLFVNLDCYDETVAEGLLADTCLPKVAASFLKGKKRIKSHHVLRKPGEYGDEILSGLFQDPKSQAHSVGHTMKLHW